MMPLLWVVVGGLLEPVWVIGLKKYNSTRSLLWGTFAVFFMILSPALLAIGMKDMAVGTSYSIWTGIGIVATLLFGYTLYKERPGKVRIALAMVILICVVLLELTQGA